MKEETPLGVSRLDPNLLAPAIIRTRRSNSKQRENTKHVLDFECGQWGLQNVLTARSNPRFSRIRPGASG